MKKFALLSMLLGLSLFVAGCSDSKKPVKPVKPASGAVNPTPDSGATPDVGPAKTDDGEPKDAPDDEPKDGDDSTTGDNEPE